MPPGFLEAVTAVGAPAAILFALLYFLERKEHKANVDGLLSDLKAERAENRIVQREATEAMVAVRTTFDVMARVLGAPK